MGRVENKVALVTGAGSGLGRSSALRLAEEGARVVVTDLNAEGGAETVAQITAAGGDAFFLQHNVAEEEQWLSVLAEVEKRYGQLDILVNNAGVFLVKPIATTSLEEFRWQNSINVEGVFLGIKYGIELMEKSGGGSIVNISSIAGLVGTAVSPAYCGSKGAVRLLTKGCAMECAQKKNKIRINSIHPGGMLTPMLEEGMKALGGGDKVRKGFENMAPIGHLGEALDIANGVVYLASEEAKYITGAELVIDGGITAA